MKIKELKDGMQKVDTEGIITDVKEPRTVKLRAGGTAEVVDVILMDDTGQIKMTLWDAQIAMVSMGDKVLRPGRRLQIGNGYVNSYQGTLQLSVGKYGSLKAEKIGT